MSVENLPLSADLKMVIWFTGLSGAGKTTLAKALHEKALVQGLSVAFLDGDEIRKKHPGRGFSREDRIKHNTEIVDHLCKEELKNHNLVIVATINPYQEVRDYARKQLPNYFEVYVATPLEVCIERDPKGLYKRVQSGEIQNMTGIHQPYEVPACPDCRVSTENQSIEECVHRLILSLVAFMQEVDRV